MPATQLGTTPITFKYARVFSKKWGFGGLPFWLFTEDGHDAHETLDIEQGNRVFLAFHVLLVKDGYKRSSMYQISGDRKTGYWGVANVNSLNGGVQRTFTALLEPSAPPIQPPVPPIQAPASHSGQQQQQQQQTVVVTESNDKKKDTGTVIVSCNVESAEVLVDGVFVGNAPATLKLKDGIHIIEVKQSGYSSYRKELRVFADSDVSLRVELTKGGKSDN